MQILWFMLMKFAIYIRFLSRVSVPVQYNAKTWDLREQIIIAHATISPLRSRSGREFPCGFPSISILVIHYYARLQHKHVQMLTLENRMTKSRRLSSSSSLVRSSDFIWTVAEKLVRFHYLIFLSFLSCLIRGFSLVSHLKILGKNK